MFGDLGEPDAYIKGDEGSGAFVVGLRYGSGWLIRKTREPQEVYWKGPSIGFDVGGNASKCFTLVYNLREDRRLFQRFPGVEGSFYFVAGLGVNYQRSGGVTLAPIRTGVGFRAGANVALSGLFRQAGLVPAYKPRRLAATRLASRQASARRFCRAFDLAGQARADTAAAPPRHRWTRRCPPRCRTGWRGEIEQHRAAEDSSGISDSAVAADVRMVRVTIWLVERLIRSASDMRLYLRRFSRIRSNTTTVSLIE